MPSESEFLTGKALSDRIRMICRAEEVDCAVAFLGKHMRDDLFPNWATQKVRIACDISMGCTSRGALEAFGAPHNPNLIVHDGLHGKVYLSGIGAVVGSSNLSLNGIGLSQGEPGNIETGVFLPATSEAFRRAKAWLQAVFDTDVVIDNKQLDRAPIRTRDPGRRIGPDGLASTSVLARVMAEPGRFAGTIFLSTEDDLGKQQLVEGKVIYAKAQADGVFEPAKRVQFWLGSVSSDCPHPTSAVMFWQGKNPRPEVYAYRNVVAIKTGSDIALYGQPCWNRYWKEHNMIAPDRRASYKEDVSIVRTIGDDGEWFLSAQELGDVLLDRSEG